MNAKFGNVCPARPSVIPICGGASHEPSKYAMSFYSTDNEKDCINVQICKHCGSLYAEN